MEINEMLSGVGLKCTKQRIMIMERLSKSPVPLTAEEIHERVDMSLSTVYRTVETLCEKGIVNKHTIRDSDKFYYEMITDKHRHYAICLGCRRMKYVDVCPVHTARVDGFTVTGHKLEIYGYCDECRKKNATL